MRWPLPALLALGGCAQIFGLEATSQIQPDARIDARATDPTTGACYVLFTTPTTRDAARAACQALDPTARLASIQTSTEDTLITSLVGTTISAWLGGSDEALEMTFVWDDGAPVVLTHWYTGEPNNGLGMFEEDCMVVHGVFAGAWDDRPCVPVVGGPPAEYGYICERP